MDRIWLSSPHMGGAEQNFVNLAFEENWIAPIGPNLNGFEKDICEFTGAKHCVGLNSCTAAIHLALNGCITGQNPKYDDPKFHQLFLKKLN